MKILIFQLEIIKIQVAKSFGDVKKFTESFLGTAITIVRTVGMGIAIIIITVLGMKYMMSSAGDRADIKKHAVAYVIGAMILFASSALLGIIANFADKAFSG